MDLQDLRNGQRRAFEGFECGIMDGTRRVNMRI